MARLFVTPREIDLISDLTKEVIKDISGQKVYYYRVREDLSDVHDVYEESPNKIFDQPVEIEARVEYQPEEIRTNQFGSESSYSITSVVVESNIYGQIEHSIGVKATGKQARMGQIDVTPVGPTSERLADEDAVQDTFVQQRGFSENSLGETGDKRQLQEDGKLDAPIEKPAEVSSKGDISSIDSSFYGDEDC